MSSKPGRLVAGCLAALFLAVAIGLVVLWPGDEQAAVGPIAAGEIVGATVDRVSGEGCQQLAGQGCRARK